MINGHDATGHSVCGTERSQCVSLHVSCVILPAKRSQCVARHDAEPSIDAQ